MHKEVVLSRIPRPDDEWWVEIQTVGGRWLHFDETAMRMVERFLPTAISGSRPEQLSVAGQMSRGHEYAYLWDPRSSKLWGPEWELAYISQSGNLYRRWIPEEPISEKQAATDAEEFHRGILCALQGRAPTGTESQDFNAGFEFARREVLAADT